MKRYLFTYVHKFSRMRENPKVLVGYAFIFLILLAGAFQFLGTAETPEIEGALSEAAIIRQALVAEGIIVDTVIIADSEDLEEAFSITIAGDTGVLVLFKSRYESVGTGAAGEYVTVLTKTLESNDDIDYVLTIAIDIVGGVSRSPILAWGDRVLIEDIKGKDPTGAYNDLNLKNLELEEVVSWLPEEN